MEMVQENRDSIFEVPVEALTSLCSNPRKINEIVDRLNPETDFDALIVRKRTLKRELYVGYNGSRNSNFPQYLLSCLYSDNKEIRDKCFTYIILELLNQYKQLLEKGDNENYEFFIAEFNKICIKEKPDIIILVEPNLNLYSQIKKNYEMIEQFSKVYIFNHPEKIFGWRSNTIFGN
jgi:hypothetical protein